MKNTVFPLRIAEGIAFCNRVDERNKISAYIKAGHHLWLQAHRRHGKTSLLLQVQQDNLDNNERIVLHRIDLAFSASKDDMIAALCDGASTLVSKLVKTSKNLDDKSLLQTLMMKMDSSIASFSPSVALERGLPTIRFSAPPSLDMLKKVLKYLDEIAVEFAVKAVFVIDEFQQIGKAHSKKDKDFAIEGTIRHCLELSQNTCYVFSGSENTLMTQAMTNEHRPLYNHTFKVAVNRISADCYLSHIGKLWQTRWDVVMPLSIFDDIMMLSQRHPYYVNKLCSQLWLLAEIPNEKAVHQCWRIVVEDERHDHKRITLSLSSNELLMAKALSRQPTSEPMSKGFTSNLDIAHGSIGRTLEQLTEKEIIYIDDSVFYVINPVLAHLLSQRTMLHS